MIKKTLLNRLSKPKTNSNTPVSYSLSKEIGIISIYEKSQELKAMLEQLEADGKSPRIISYLDKPDKKILYPENTFSPKDISLSGNITSREVLYFSEQKYDFLISLDDLGNMYIKYIMAITQASHKVGLYHQDMENILDLMIKPNSGQNVLEEMIRYIKMIRHD